MGGEPNLFSLQVCQGQNNEYNFKQSSKCLYLYCHHYNLMCYFESEISFEVYWFDHFHMLVLEKITRKFKLANVPYPRAEVPTTWKHLDTDVLYIFTCEWVISTAFARWNIVFHDFCAFLLLCKFLLCFEVKQGINKLGKKNTHKWWFYNWVKIYFDILRDNVYSLQYLNMLL